MNLLASELAPAVAISAAIAAGTGMPSTRAGGGARKGSGDAGDDVDEEELAPMIGIL